MQQHHSQPDVSLSEKWIAHQRKLNKTTLCYACIFCEHHPVFSTEQALWTHCSSQHHELLPSESEALEAFRKDYIRKSEEKRASKNDNSQTRPPNLNESNRAQPEPPPVQLQGKRPLSQPLLPARSISGIGALAITPGTPGGASDVAMRDASDAEHSDRPQKRAAIGSGISQGSASPRRDSTSPPRRSKARPTSAPFSSRSEAGIPEADMSEAQRRPAGKQLWTERDTPLTKSDFQDSSNHAAVAGARSRNRLLHEKSRKPIPPSPTNTRAQIPPSVQDTENPDLTREPSAQSLKDESYDIILQPETRPISQEQLVAEVKGIYAGLVMVEAKCIEVDNKQATLAQADPTAQPKLNNEQWQALIALHRTLLHEHHDFFLASQHPSASPALRRLASKYAMPARMWRHGIHSFLELLRHRLPASLDHMLAFIYLAYSMMALLYETVPAFEDTWIECLGDLGRYRMAIEDDDIRDREVWTGVARHWYSKASDKAPTTGRLYHHLAILARPVALQQLFYYSKSLCVVIPFTSARESILTLFEPVLKTDGAQGQYRLPPLDNAFVKAHGLLFTNRSMEKFEPTCKEFLNLLDNQIGRVTRKFMEQGYHIAVANNVAMLEYGSKSNALMKAILPGEDVDMVNAQVESPNSMTFFENAQRLSNATLEIVLKRIGDPNVLPFIHVTLVWLFNMARHPAAMEHLQADFPWELLSVMLNTLLAAYGLPGRIEDDSFPLPEKDDVRPFPEDFAMRGLLWAEDYFPPEWFTNEKIDEEEKYHERPSMTSQRKERILWLACRVAALGPWLNYDAQHFSACSQIEKLANRSMTFASATTTETSNTSDTEYPSDAEEDLRRPALPAAAPISHD